MLSTARKVVLAGTRSLAVVATVLALGMMVTISYDVLARYAFRAPTEWAYPLNSSALLGVTLLVVPHLYATGGHISMDLLHRAMPPRTRRVADVATALAAALLGAVLAVTGFDAMVLAYTHGLTGSGTFNIPLWVPDAALVVSGIFLVLVALLFPPHPESAGQDGANP